MKKPTPFFTEQATREANTTTPRKLKLTFSSPEAEAWAITALLQGRAISTQHQIDEVGGWRLGAIVCALKKPPFFWKIDTHKVGSKRVAHYFFSFFTVVSELTMPAGLEHLVRIAGGEIGHL